MLQQHAHCPWTATVIELIIFIAYGACWDINVCVAIIHRTLTWTARSLSSARMLMQAIAHGGVRTPKESVHWKLTLVEKSLAAPGNRTCVSGVTVRCCNPLSYIPSAQCKKSLSRCRHQTWWSIVNGFTHQPLHTFRYTLRRISLSQSIFTYCQWIRSATMNSFFFLGGVGVCVWMNSLISHYRLFTT